MQILALLKSFCSLFKPLLTDIFVYDNAYSVDRNDPILHDPGMFNILGIQLLTCHSFRAIVSYFLFMHTIKIGTP